MQLTQFPIFLSLASFVFVLFLFFLLKSRKVSPNLPPGPRKLPLIGNLHNLTGALPHRALHGLALKYGPLMHLQLGELSTVVVSSPEVAKQVMKTHDVNFASRPFTSQSEIIFYGSTDVGWAPYGDYWRQLRKICTLELLTKKRVQSFRFIREEVCMGLMKWIASNEGSPVNLSEKLHSSTFEIVSRSALGDVIKEKDSMVSIFTGISVLSSGFNIEDFFPSIGLFRRFNRSRQRLKKYHDDLDIILEKIIQEHRAANNMTDKKEKEKEKEKEKPEYFVDVLLKQQDGKREFHLSTDNIKAMIMDVFIGGSDTSAATSIWALAEMIKDPRIIEKVQQEVRQVFDPKGYVDESDIDQLKYLKCVIKETMRLHPPGPLLLPRKCINKCEINGYEIPTETKVLINAWAVNNDPSYWNDPYSFQPERFIDNKVNYEGNNFEYIPFGAGRRMCPAITLGIADVQLPLAMLLYYFDWTLPGKMEPQEMDMMEVLGSTLMRKKPLYVVPMLRRAIPDQTKPCTDGL